MNILEWIAGLRSYARRAALIDRVVARSQSCVWQRVSDRLGAMSQAEARGYVRARAALVIHREVDIATKCLSWVKPNVRAAVAAMATERVVQRTLVERLRVRREQMSLRRAA